jgi:hypothetical protein
MGCLDLKTFLRPPWTESLLATPESGYTQKIPREPEVLRKKPTIPQCAEALRMTTGRVVPSRMPSSRR